MSGNTVSKVETKTTTQSVTVDNVNEYVTGLVDEYVTGLINESEDPVKKSIKIQKDDIIIFLSGLNSPDRKFFMDEVKDGKTLLAKYKDLKSSVQYSVGKTANHLKFLSHEYDDFFSKNEMANSIFTSIAPIGGYVPFFSLATNLARIIQLGNVKIMKTQELYYICSACLAFTSLNSVNIKKMLLYFAEHNIETELTSIFTTTQTNCYKFFLFLINVK